MTSVAGNPGDYTESFFGGAGVFLILAGTIAAQVWLLTRRVGRYGQDVDLSADHSPQTEPAVDEPPTRRAWWQALGLMVFLLGKTALVGGSVYWCLWVRGMYLPLFFAGLVSGLALLLLVGVWSRSGLAKKQKYH